MNNTALKADLATLHEALEEAVVYVETMLALGDNAPADAPFDPCCPRLNLVRDSLKLVKLRYGHTSPASVQAEGQALGATA